MDLLAKKNSVSSWASTHDELHVAEAAVVVAGRVWGRVKQGLGDLRTRARPQATASGFPMVLMVEPWFKAA